METEFLYSEMGFTKSKKIKLSNDAHTFLHLHILQVEGNKACGVVSWVHPGEESKTEIVNGFPSPDWDTRRIIYVGQRPYNHKFLYLEVLRFTSENEAAGTSNGKVIMGRAKITLPKELNNEITESFQLLKLNYEEKKSEVVGRIILSMKLEEVKGLYI